MILKLKLSALAIELSALQLCTQASTSLPSYSGRCCPPSPEALSSPSPTIWASKLSLPSDSGECDSRTVSVLCHQRSHAVVTLEQAETQRSLALSPLLPPDTLLIPSPAPLLVPSPREPAHQLSSPTSQLSRHHFSSSALAATSVVTQCHKQNASSWLFLPHPLLHLILTQVSGEHFGWTVGQPQ